MNAMIDCYCNLCDDYDGPDWCEDEDEQLYFDREVVASKVHACCECGRSIMSGDRYMFIWGRWDEQWSGFTTCKVCWKIAHQFFCGCWAHGGLGEALWEVFEIRLT